MLAQEVVRKYEGARFVVEDFGASPLAERFGIDKYPAIFVDDALVAIPEDFYAWGGAGDGKYIPWKDLENRRKFQRDLQRMIEIRLRGSDLPQRTPSKSGTSPRTTLPAGISITDLGGESFRFEELRGKPVLVEFWAPWCPPCLETMTWLKKLQPSEAHIVALAVASERAAVDRVVEKLAPPGRIAMASQEIVDAFGGIPAVPMLFLADRNGNLVQAFYGAPPDLHDQIDQALEKLKSRGQV